MEGMPCGSLHLPTELVAPIPNQDLAWHSLQVQHLLESWCCRLRRDFHVSWLLDTWRVTLAGLQGSSDSRAYPKRASTFCRPQGDPLPLGWVPSRLEWLWREGSPNSLWGLHSLVEGLKWQQESRWSRKRKDGVEHSKTSLISKKKKKKANGWSSGKGKRIMVIMSS